MHETFDGGPEMLQMQYYNGQCCSLLLVDLHAPESHWGIWGICWLKSIAIMLFNLSSET